MATMPFDSALSDVAFITVFFASIITLAFLSPSVSLVVLFCT
jgi:hypothetical protein